MFNVQVVVSSFFIWFYIFAAISRRPFFEFIVR